MSQRWTADQIPDQSGRTVVVTGANSGLGYVTAEALAGAGATVVLACRSQAKADDAATRVAAAVPDADVSGVVLDLGMLASVRSCADALLATCSRIDVLMNNAGVMMPPRTLTPDGSESQFGTNHLGHFALTGLLMPLLDAAPAARVVTVSSLEHKPGRIHWDDLTGEVDYSPRGFYQQSKFANAVFGLELDRRLRRAQSPTISLLAHPGYSATNLQSSGPTGLAKQAMRVTNKVLAQDPRRGALPQLFAATDPTALGGEFLGPDGFMEARGFPTRVQPVKTAQDEQTGSRLWSLSQELTQVQYL